MIVTYIGLREPSLMLSRYGNQRDQKLHVLSIEVTKVLEKVVGTVLVLLLELILKDGTCYTGSTTLKELFIRRK